MTNGDPVDRSSTQLFAKLSSAFSKLCVRNWAMASIGLLPFNSIELYNRTYHCSNPEECGPKKSSYLVATTAATPFLSCLPSLKSGSHEWNLATLSAAHAASEWPPCLVRSSSSVRTKAIADLASADHVSIWVHWIGRLEFNGEESFDFEEFVGENDNTPVSIAGPAPAGLAECRARTHMLFLLLQTTRHGNANSCCKRKANEWNLRVQPRPPTSVPKPTPRNHSLGWPGFRSPRSLITPTLRVTRSCNCMMQVGGRMSSWMRAKALWLMQGYDKFFMNTGFSAFCL